MIAELTAAQKARFPEFVDKWTKIGLSTESTDKGEVEKAIAAVYKCGGLVPPKQIVFCGSPLSQGLTRAFLLKVPTRKLEPIGDSVGDSVGASVRASVWDSVWDSVRDSVEDSVRDSVRASIGDSVGDSVGASVGASVRDSVRASVRASLYGQHEASWLAFYDFFAEVCGLTKETEKLSGLSRLSKCCGWILPHKTICFASPRHTTLELKNKRLHCEDGPAVAYPDGWGIWALNGVRVPQWLVETKPNDIDCAKFAKIENAEIRREFVRKVGVERISQQLGAKQLDAKDTCPCGCQADTCYELLEINLGGATGAWPYLKMRNPSLGVWHLEAVPKGVKTVEQALNFRNGGEVCHLGMS